MEESAIIVLKNDRNQAYSIMFTFCFRISIRNFYSYENYLKSNNNETNI